MGVRASRLVGEAIEMALRLGRLWKEKESELRYEPTAKRVRALRDGRTMFDTTRAVLVWKVGEMVPSYAVPAEELLFSVGDGALRLEDPDLASYVLLHFRAFDTWMEEEEVVRGHARDPFHRVDIRRSSRHVRVEVEGEVIAESSQPTMLFETKLPPRVYVPRADIRAELLRPSASRTVCAYKGDASYFSVAVGGRTIEDGAWTYEAPFDDAVGITGLVSFYDDRVSVFLDGEKLGVSR